MRTVVAPIFSAPAPVLAFGLGGLIPFVALTALGIFVPGTLHLFWLTTLTHYGAVILAFVGALQWGYAVTGQATGKQAWIRYGWSVLPALIGCLSLQFSVWSGLRLQAGTLILSIVVDRAFAAKSAAPTWLMPVRYLLTAVAVTCLLVASFTR